MQTPAFTIAPRYADKKNTVPMPTWRNVFASDGAYVGSVCVHDGAWTPLYRTEDFQHPEIMATLQAAAAQMNGATGPHIAIEQVYAGEEAAAHERLTAEGFEPVGEESVVVDVVSAILYYRITERGVQYRLVEITNEERP